MLFKSAYWFAYSKTLVQTLRHYRSSLDKVFDKVSFQEAPR